MGGSRKEEQAMGGKTLYMGGQSPWGREYTKGESAVGGKADGGGKSVHGGKVLGDGWSWGKKLSSVSCKYSKSYCRRL